MSRQRHKRAAVAWLIVGLFNLAGAIGLAWRTHALWATELRHLGQGVVLICAVECAWHLGWLSRDGKPPVAEVRHDRT